MKKLCLTILIVMFIGVSAVSSMAQEGSIPNTTIGQTEDTGAIPNLTEDPNDTNGRAAHLDTEKEGDQLNPVERTIIIRDAIITNAPTMLGN